MKHRPFENWILFDLPLTLQEQAEMDNHLAQCLACRALQSGVVRAEAGFRGARLAEPRSGFVARWRNRLDQETERRRHGTAWWTFAWTTLAAVPFALTLGWQALVLPGSLSTLLADLLLQLIRWWTWLRLVGEPFRWGCGADALGPFLLSSGFRLVRLVAAPELHAIAGATRGPILYGEGVAIADRVA